VPIHLVTEGVFDMTTAEISIALRAAAADRADVLEFRNGSPPAGNPWVEVRESEITANLAKVTGATLHIRDTAHDTSAEQIAVDGLLMVGLAFERLGQDDIASRLASTYFARSSVAGDIDVAFALAASMARAHRISEALELSDRLDDMDWRQLEDIALLFGFPALYKAKSLSKVEIEQHERVLKARVKRRKKHDRIATARAYMNLASFQRGIQRWDAAANFYREAQKLDPSYTERPYFWFEYGGALWGTRQFAKAVDAYARSIELGTTEPLAHALHADSLLFAGRYAEALELFNMYDQTHPEDDGEYRLKARACRAIVERLGIREQDRQSFKSVNAADNIDQTSPQEWAAMSRRQLALDALWGSAWLNLGLSQHHLSQYGEALDSFVASTILMPEDYETWQNAMFTAFRVREVDVLRDLVVSGRRMGSDALIAFVVEAAADPKCQIARREFTGIVDGVLAKHPSRTRAGFTVRLITEDGHVEEVPIEEKPSGSR
jgi:tetratricopeptide (TPR) repeat protein